jgi:hypothetical protein
LGDRLFYRHSVPVYRQAERGIQRRRAG